MCVFVEVKTDNAFFRAEDEETPYEDSDDPVPTGRTMDCATQIRLEQHRQTQYSVVTLRSTAWLLRWDQVGALVATSFDYKKDPYLLARFFYLIGQMNDSQLGLDPTLQPLEQDDQKLWDQYLEEVTDEDLRKHLKLHAVHLTRFRTKLATSSRALHCEKRTFSPLHRTSCRPQSSKSKSLRNLQSGPRARVPRGPRPEAPAQSPAVCTRRCTLH